MRYFLFIILLCGSNAIAQSRKTLDFNTHWAFHRGEVKNGEDVGLDDKDWLAVSVPHVMRIEKKHNGGNQVYQGIGWYRRYFRLSPADRGKRISICFDGVQTNCTVFLNGRQITTHAGGYMGFVADITQAVQWDRQNILAIRVSNTDDPHTPPGKPQAKLDFNYFGGIYRNVRLLITSPLYISHPLEASKVAGGGVFISCGEATGEHATVKINTHLVNAGAPAGARLVSRLLDGHGVVVASADNRATLLQGGDTTLYQQLQVHQPQLWHPDHPYLYRLVSLVYNNNKLADSLVTYTGIRHLAFRPDGFYLNGERLYLRGANRHQAYQNIGDAASDRLQYLDAVQLKRGGFNAVRAAHYPQSPAFLDACDSLGLLVIACEPGWQYFSKDPLFVNNTYRDIREMIRRDRNHPSVFLWETSLNESPTPASWMQQAVSVAHQEMPGDQLFLADDFNARSRDYYNVSYKVVNEDGSDPMPSRPFLTREWGDSWMADAAGENSLRASRMYTEKGMINQCVLRQNALNGETSEAAGGYWDHGGLDAHPRIGGYFVWSYNDYARGADAVTAFSGVVDLDRYEKFGYYQLQSMQQARNPVYGPMVFIASFNNQPSDTSIMVFSNCDTVQLFRNGQLVGQSTRSQNAAMAPHVAAKGGSPYFIFHTGKYEAGELKAIGFVDGKAVHEHVVRTPQEPDHLEIVIPEGQPVAPANGWEMTPFYVKVCDKYGTLVSNKKAAQTYDIRIAITGEGHLIGGNIPDAGISLQATEGGIAYGIIRHGAKAGDITISAHSPGIKAAAKTFRMLPADAAQVSDGHHATWKSEDEANISGYYAHAVINPHLQEISLQNKPVTVTPLSNDASVHKITDNNTTTGWTAGTHALPVTITIDLEGNYLLDGSRIVWGKDSDWYIYSVSVSADGNDWKQVKAPEKVSGQDYKPVTIPAVEARFLRVSVSGMQPETSKVSVKEITLYGSKK
ncbi:MAG TPA: glycoside hydrolase family 2 TIM barrel-domain containing protein [Chitinophaga sp.]|uniref:glycoside hydrolase family 2 TIM barrel-domain containing protein n=1 Tax=Chitinophaga sp. TaxID=1869181 RepID=UPI002C3D5FDC|nr:glycoside hydrolase family 2 TIM barrel-domain containing protein [Chitinophaga sp.]HVI48237.1 glycoside hydrolase family 2 TIM barrel-domain containing protein [Chitinophaga sp.]